MGERWEKDEGVEREDRGRMEVGRGGSEWRDEWKDNKPIVTFPNKPFVTPSTRPQSVQRLMCIYTYIYMYIYW